MQRIVIDTNVLVSAFIQKFYPHLILNSLPKENTQWCISNDVLDEYAAVLRRTKFIKYTGFTANAESLLTDIEKITVKYSPKMKIEVIKDFSDNKFLELAEECKADFLITGNTQDFTMSNFGNTVIITPKEYWEKFRYVAGE